MIRTLRIIFTLHFLIMFGTTVWASMQTPIWAIPDVVLDDPWFMATLIDAYLGFLTFFVWVAYKETTLLRQAAWFIGIMLLGNMAMAAYVLRETFRMNATSTIQDFLVQRCPQNP